MKLYIAYDERAIGIKEDEIKETMLLECFSNIPRKKKLKKDYGIGIVYSYDIAKGNNLTNPKEVYVF